MNDFSREINDRIIKLQHKIRESGLTGALLTERTNVYYFSGSGQQCHLYVPAEGKPLLMVKRTVAKAMIESPLENIVSLKSSKEIPQVLLNHDFKINGRIAMELDVLPANSYFFYKKVLESSEIVDVSCMVRDIRMIKSEFETSLIKESGIKHGEVFKYIGSAIKEGMSDRELAGAIEGYARKIGHLGYIRFRGLNVEFYFGHALVGAAGAASGPYDVMATVGAGSHPTFPQGVSGISIKRGDPIYIDYVGNYTGYLVDQSRTFALGKLPLIMEKAADVSMELQGMLQNSLKEGVNGRDLYDSSLKIVEKSGLKDYFMGYPKGVPFIGHGIGLEVNEWPVIAKGVDMELKSGMVLALEPKFVFPDMGVVGVENTYIVLKEGFEQLTKGEDTIRYA